MSQQQPKFQCPVSLADCRRRMHELQNVIQGIELQLSDPNRTDKETRRRLSLTDYKIWRNRALGRMTSAKLEYSFLKEWRRNENIKLSESASKVDPVQRLINEYFALEHKQRQDVLDVILAEGK